MRILLDENVSLALAKALRDRGHQVRAVADLDIRGAADTAVWQLACDDQALLITRDYHFTNPVRFNPADCLGIVFIRHGNLTAAQETMLVIGFLDAHPVEAYEGKVVSLSREGGRLR